MKNNVELFALGVEKMSLCGWEMPVLGNFREEVGENIIIST